MNALKFNPFWRPPFELFAGIGWLLFSLVAGLFAYYGDYGFRFLFLAAIPMSAIGLFRVYQGISHVEFAAKLFALKDLKGIDLPWLVKQTKKNPKKVYMGHGMEWDQRHAQTAYDFNRLNKNTLKPSALYMSIRKLFGVSSNGKAKGTTYLHAALEGEKPIYQNLEDRFTHRGISGSNGTGKGRVLAIDIIQAIARGEAVTMLDPKKDKMTIDICYATCKYLKQEHRFFFFDVAYPERSVRLNPLKNYQDISELATRVVGVLPPDSDKVFANFAWNHVNTIFGVMELMGDSPTLVKLRRLIDQSPYKLMALAGLPFLIKNPKTKPLVMQYEGSKDYENVGRDLMKIYQEQLDEDERHVYINQLIDLTVSSQEHNRKLYNSIIPILEQLTSGEFKELLSPDPTDNDPRPIIDLASAARRGDVLYINLGSLRKGEVGSAFGALLFNDAISVVADRSDYEEDGKRTIWNLYCDEAAEIVNANTVRMANKSRSSEVCLTLAFQTTSDLVERFGSESMKDQTTGNTNTKTTLRAEDRKSQEYISELSKDTTVQELNRATGTQANTAIEGQDSNNTYTKQLKSTTVPLISTTDVGSLADLHCFTIMPGGFTYKLRVPFITVPDEYKYPMEPHENGPFGVLPDQEEIGSRAPDPRIQYEPLSE